MTRPRLPSALAPLLAAAWLFAAPAFAHKVNMFAYVEGDRILIEGYFADGKKAAQAEVTLLDTSGTPLASGVTDGEGQLTVPVPSKDDVRIILNAGMGHQTEYTIFANELGGTGKDIAGQPPADEPDGALPDTSPAGAAAQALATPDRAAAAPPAALEPAIERAVGQAILPLMRSVSEMREEKDLGAIIGGIGYIFGLLGLFYYVKARNTNKS